MFAIKKNQIIITALVLMVAAAGYLNYIDSSPQDSAAVMMTDEGDLAVVGDDGEVAVSDDNTDIEVIEQAEAVTTNEAAGPDSGDAVFVSTSQGSDYFISAKLDREQSRSKQKDMLNEMINNNNLDSEKKNEVTTAMLQLQQRIEKETAAEAMIESKGFKEVYVRIDDDTVDVVVDKAQLTESEIAQIQDIVKRKTGMPIDKIRISPLKKSE
jgi:stage III sporulation protein AH